MWYAKHLKNITFVLLFLVVFVGSAFAGGDSKKEDVDVEVKLIGKEYKFEPETLKVPAGKNVRIIFKNKGTIAHDFFIKQLDFKTEPIQPGNQTTYTFTAPEKETTLNYACQVAGHEPAGMKGKIVVQADGNGSASSNEENASDQSSSQNQSGNDSDSKKKNGNNRGETVEQKLRDRLGQRRNADRPDGWGAIRGNVILEGEPPEPYSNEGASIFEKQCGLEGAFEIQHVDVHEETGGIKDTLVYVENVDSVNKELRPPETATIVQKNCRFHPSVQVVRTNGEIELVNRDPAVHNFKYTPTDPLNSTKGNLTQQGKEGSTTVDKIHITSSDVYASICNVHPWMNGLFLAVDHHGYDVTGAKGQFQIQLPPGEYKLHVRHYTQKKGKTVTIEVPKGDVLRKNIALKLK